MPSTKIQSIFSDKPTFPPREMVLEMFDQVFTLSHDDGEDDKEIADALIELIDLLSNVSSSMDAQVGQRLAQWVHDHWTSQPGEQLENLCALLVNAYNDESLAILREKLAETVEPTARATIEDAIRTHPTAKPKPVVEANVEEEEEEEEEEEI